VSLIGAVACVTIATELYDDIFHEHDRASHFALPKQVKFAALVGFTVWSLLEARKVRHRVENILP
jgi:hypothetical protein